MVDPLGRLINSLVLPLSNQLTIGLNRTGDFFGGLANAGRLSAENRKLKQLVRSWELYQERSDWMAKRIDDVRRIQGLPQYVSREKVAADVLSFDPYTHRMTLSVGSNQGVSAGLAVVSFEGLVGVIQSVEPTRSQVLLVSSPSLRVGGMIARTPPIAGILRGRTSETMSLGYLESKTAMIKVGDKVVTSLHSERIPAFIPVGEVIAQSVQPEYGVVDMEVLINVQLARIREVIVYK